MPRIFKSILNLLIFVLLIDQANQAEQNTYKQLSTTLNHLLEQIYSGF
jgi:hypothetical protein